MGWPNPSYQFDRIIMTAACSEVPEALAHQLVNGGIMLLPFDDGNDQTLMQITKTPNGLISEAVEKVSFVPLLSGLG
jgi:protein-L-isoaspartate(D-aspartate) O-methyltransferase